MKSYAVCRPRLSRYPIKPCSGNPGQDSRGIDEKVGLQIWAPYLAIGWPGPLPLPRPMVTWPAVAIERA